MSDCPKRKNVKVDQFRESIQDDPIESVLNLTLLTLFREIKMVETQMQSPGN